MIGSLIGHMIIKKDMISTALGIGSGIGIAYTINYSNPMYLLATLLFVSLIYLRKYYVQYKIK